MVAYNFKAVFAGQVAALAKLQTVRADRRRHARPEEGVQLYCGMRTVQCRKLVEPDPICRDVRPITIVTNPLVEDFIASIVIGARPLDRSEIEAFARADGFAPDVVGDWRFERTGHIGSARWNMGAFWQASHGAGRFDGVLITWRPA
ncbi:MAG: ASCH domain-containing protein [Rhizobiaceae bacterium]|nr:ASCH domain-containing protein [Rhizobiaceae bacterium]